MMRMLVTALMWLGCVSAASAQSTTTLEGLIHTFVTDFRHIATLDNGVIVGGATGVAAALVPHERRVVRLATRADGMDDAFNAAQPIGHGLAQIGSAGTLFVMGHLAHRPRVAELGQRLMRAQAVNGAMTHAVKFAVRRTRPDGGPRSFPSGHTSAAFATATVLQRELGWKVGVPSYLMAGYIGTSRAAANKHYVSDLVVGAALGIAAGRAVTTLPGTHRTVTLSPLVKGTGGGLMLTWMSRP